jgi:hypothetical protein
MTSNSDGDAYVAKTAALVDLMDRAVAAVEEAQELIGEEDQSITALMLRSMCFEVRDVRGRLERRLALQRGGG